MCTVVRAVCQMSTLAVSPFFVENVSEIQLNALKLVTCVSLLSCCSLCTFVAGMLKSDIFDIRLSKRKNRFSFNIEF